MSPLGIIGAMPQEISILGEYLVNAKTIETAGMTQMSGELNGVPVVVMQCGIGKVNATIGTTLMIRQYQPKVIINTGSAGGIGKGLVVGDIVIGDNVTHHDVDLTEFGYALGQMAQMPETYLCDRRLVDLAKSSAQSPGAFPNATVHCGQMVSGDQFIANSQQFASIQARFPDALAVEMEAAAIAQTCYRLGVSFVVIRAISDLANEEAIISFEAFIDRVGKQSADMVVSLINQIASR